MEEIIKKITPKGFPYWDNTALAVIDFKKQKVFHWEACVKERKKSIMFDLSSLTKALIFGIWSLDKSLGDELALLEHRAGIPSWGLLDKIHWKDDLNQIYFAKSLDFKTCYSDLSILKFQLYCEKFYSESLEKLTSLYWSHCAYHWKSNEIISLGLKVHDDNARNLNCFLAHAGLFSSIEKLSEGLVYLNNTFDFIQKVKAKLISRKIAHRFCYGWDTVGENNPHSLAGHHSHPFVFGHLGFSGCSFWIDPEKFKGYIFLTDATKYYWYHREYLNQLRRDLGEYIWNN